MRLRDVFYLNKNDRQVITFLLAIMVVILAVIVFVDDKDMMAVVDNTDNTHSEKVNANSISRVSGKQGHGYYAVETSKTSERFPFDPNTADSTQLLRLGLQPWQVRSIYKYRAAGGIYRTPTDFAKLYGLTKKQYELLAPYIRISDDYKPASDFYKTQRKNDPVNIAVSPYHSNKLRPGERINLNTADTSLLMRVPGIGPYFAKRVEGYRKRLGGFYSERQLMEIEFFPEDAVHFFFVGEGEIRKLNVNKLSLSELKRHPYINYYQAKDILDYRRLRGTIHNIDELRLLKDFTDRDLQRLKPYLEY